MSTHTVTNPHFSLRPLVGLLMVQLLLALWLLWPSSKDSLAGKPLLVNPSAALASLVITQGEDELILTQHNNRWQLSSYFDLPVRQSKINDALQTLESLKTGWPVASSSSAAERFEVAEKKFQRKLKLSWADGKEQTLYLGTSPGYRKQHVRLEASDEIYALELSAYQFAATGNSWLDTSLLAIKELAKVQSSEFAVLKQGDNWQFEGPKVNELDSKAWDSWLTQIQNLTVQEAFDATQANELRQGKSQLVLKLWSQADAQSTQPTVTYNLYEKEKEYWLLSSAYPQAFKLSQAQADVLKGFKLDDFIKEPATEPRSPEPELIKEKSLDEMLKPKEGQ